MPLNYPLHPTYLRSCESPTILQLNRIQPELGYQIVTRDMYVSWLCSIARVEEKTIWSISPYYRHPSPTGFR